MEMFEKVEKLREHANVTYEEAKAALEEANGDLLEAIVLLEKQGKTNTSGCGSSAAFSGEQTECLMRQDKTEEQKKTASSSGRTFGDAFRRFWNFIRNTNFSVTRREKTLFMLPSWIFAIILLCTWKGLVPVMVAALIFGFRYSFLGPEYTKGKDIANDFLDKAGSFADGLESSLKKA